jgi:hypothetical protein
MSTLTISIPDSVRSRIEFFAGKDGVSVERYVSAVLAQRIAVADADLIVQKRTKEGSPERLWELLAAAPDVAPEPQDRIGPKKD